MRRFLYILSLFLSSIFAQSAITITQATGGGALCSDAYTTLGDIKLTENNSKDFNAGTNVTLILSVPAGYVFNPGVGSVSYTAARNITSASIGITSTTITITYTAAAENKADILTISGIQVKASAALPIAATANITRTAGTGTIDGGGVGAIFGALTQSDNRYVNNLRIEHKNLSNVIAGSVDNELIYIRVRMLGACGSALYATAFNFTTTGSTDPSNDILKAKLYYTGSSSVFATTNLLGTYDSPNGAFTINCNQLLPFNYSYFWLVYDLTSGATDLNVVDGTLENIVVNAVTHSPDVSLLAGARTIGIPLITSNGTGGGDWNNPASWIGGIIPTMASNARILDGDVINLTADAECVDLTLDGGTIGGILNLASSELIIWGNLTTNSPGNINSTCNSSLSIQDISGKSKFIFPSGIQKLKKFTINRFAGASTTQDLDLDDCVPADSIVLVLNNGVLTISSGSKLLMNSIAIQKEIPCSDDSYINGIISREVLKNTGFTLFPVGDGGMCRMFGVNHVSGGSTGIHEVQYFNRKPPNYDYIDLTNLPGGISDTFYWYHSQIAGPNPGRRLYYKSTDFTHLTTGERVTDLRMANNKVSTPTEQWSMPNTGINVNDIGEERYVQLAENAANPTAYWTIGSAGVPIVLPVELIDFSGQQEGNIIKLKFKTATEINNDYFSILKSSDAKHYELLSKIKGHGNSNMLNTYLEIDSSPFVSANYYILKQTDYDGKTIEYSPIFVNFTKSNNDFVNIYPNPAKSNETINVLISDSDIDILDYLFVSIIDLRGNELYKKYYSSFDLGNVLKIKIDLKPELYILNIKTNKFSIAKPIVIK
ncbi:MAG: hypothetical protein A2X12_03990 [Bacteroidetes bacterium GWE2_29_8]|nr:MAG: hypothetical protein A2X12_03990 [Bacteroidetes bacterium GWE2_29_8]OFY18740.1 MAG: hypothetical protein A2X02_04310 [Bacteroidetes bacterium GWF2_29_10]